MDNRCAKSALANWTRVSRPEAGDGITGVIGVDSPWGGWAGTIGVKSDGKGVELFGIFGSAT